jgi:hypothetical protein
MPNPHPSIAAFVDRTSTTAVALAIIGVASAIGGTHCAVFTKPSALKTAVDGRMVLDATAAAEQTRIDRAVSSRFGHSANTATQQTKESSPHADRMRRDLMYANPAALGPRVAAFITDDSRPRFAIKLTRLHIAVA